MCVRAAREVVAVSESQSIRVFITSHCYGVSTVVLLMEGDVWGLRGVKHATGY